jgi:hypothetical protein
MVTIHQVVNIKSLKIITNINNSKQKIQKQIYKKLPKQKPTTRNNPIKTNQRCVIIKKQIITKQDKTSVKISNSNNTYNKKNRTARLYINAIQMFNNLPRNR